MLFRDKFIKIVLEICLSKTSLKADNAKLFHLLRDNLQNVRNSRLSLSLSQNGRPGAPLSDSLCVFPPLLEICFQENVRVYVVFHIKCLLLINRKLREIYKIENGEPSVFYLSVNKLKFKFVCHHHYTKWPPIFMNCGLFSMFLHIFL